MITERLRDGYYLVREYLNNDYLNTGKINTEQFEHFMSVQGYRTYRDDLWPDLEQSKGLERPEAKPSGVIYSLGQEMTISQFDKVYHRTRGFIFVEKAGEAEDIKELSYHGWAIVAGQGYSTRLMRKLFKNDKRPVLVLHDADISGDWIYKIFDVGSRRTKHLDLWLDNVTDLGLNEQDATLLGLPSQPEAKQYRNKKKIRFELSAFSVLKHRLGLINPVLAYTVAKITEKGFRVTPRQEEISILLKESIVVKITKVLSDFQEKLFLLSEMPFEYAIQVADSLVYPKGMAIDAHGASFSKPKRFMNLYVNLIDELKQKITEEFHKYKPVLMKEAQSSVDNSIITDVDAYERRIVDMTNAEKIIEILYGKNLNG